MNYIIDHIPRSTSHNRRPGLSMSPQYITIHSTGNPKSTARNERGWLTNPSNKVTASWHICVDEKKAVEAIPLNEVAWHAGDGASGPGNRKSIGIEICESGDRAKTLANAIKLVAKMLKERGWGVDRLRRHHDWSGKICPRIFYDGGKWTGWQQFKRDIQKQLKGDDKVAKHAIVVCSHADVPGVEPLAKKLGCGVFFRDNLKDMKAETVIVAGGGKINGIQGKQVDLSGKDRWETAAKVGEYFRRLK